MFCWKDCQCIAVWRDLLSSRIPRVLRSGLRRRASARSIARPRELGGGRAGERGGRILNESPGRGAVKSVAIRRDGGIDRIECRGTNTTLLPIRARPGDCVSLDRPGKGRRRSIAGPVPSYSDGISGLRERNRIGCQRIAGRRAIRLNRCYFCFGNRPRTGNIANRLRHYNRRCRRRITSSTTASGHNSSQRYCNKPTQWPDNISEAIHKFLLVMGCRKTSLCG